MATRALPACIAKPQGVRTEETFQQGQRYQLLRAPGKLAQQSSDLQKKIAGICFPGALSRR